MERSLGSNLASASDDPDWEAEFYAIMAHNQADVDDIVTTIKKDTFDASMGQQVGITADGNVGMLLVVNQRSAKMLVDAWHGVMDHGCEAGIATIMQFFYYQGLLLSDLVPSLDPAVQATTFFEHAPQDDDD